MSADQAKYYNVLPSNVDNTVLTIYTLSDISDDSLAELAMIFERRIEIQHINSQLLEAGIKTYYRNGHSSGFVVNDKGKLDQQNLSVSDLFEDALIYQASDIHFEPFKQNFKIRFRIDGILIERYVLPMDRYPSLVNQIKIKANLDIAEKRRPQDGRIRYSSLSNEDIDLRISTVPVIEGEKIVVRVLEKNPNLLNLNKLGLGSDQLNCLEEGLQKKHGLIVVCGPTGSGKTTTLYAALIKLNKTSHNIMTIEDPVEYTLTGANQVQLNEAIGLNFPKTLKSFLRQDPDIIMLGEIRDHDTAEMAVRASITGHLVLSSLHTNTAWGAVARLIDMKIPSYLLASSICLTVSQRLVRLLCSKCKKKEAFDIQFLNGKAFSRKQIEQHYVAQGCEECNYTGYSGRKAIYEIIPINEKNANLIRRNASEKEFLSENPEHKSLSHLALKIFKQGYTSLDEIYPFLFGY